MRGAVVVASLAPLLGQSGCILLIGDEPPRRDGAGSSTVIASGLEHPLNVVVDDTAIYWTNSVAGGSVMKCALPDCAGGPTELATGQGRPYAIAIAGDQIAWTNLESGQVRSCPKEGGAAADLETMANVPSSLVALGSGVYFTQRDNGSIMRCELPPMASDCFYLMPVYAEEGADWINVVAGNLIWLRAEHDIVTCPTTADCNGDAERVTLVGGLMQASALTADDAQLYWIETTAIRAAPRAGGGADAVSTIADGEGAPAFLALDAADVYWSNTLDGTIRKAPKNGGASAVTVVSGLNGPSGLVIYGDRVYWANAGDGTIRSAAK